MRRRAAVGIAAASAALLLASCAQESTSTAASSAPAAAPASAAASEAAPADECAPENLTTVDAGKLTVGTDTPAYPPYFVDDDPSNGKGFESAVAYAVAAGLGLDATDVVWQVVPFNSSYAPGDKAFDFDINQISITPKRQKAVDFSDGYYTVNQAIVALKGSPIAKATTVAELKGAKLGAQVGTTSLDFITDVVQPTSDVQVFNDTNDAKSAMQNEQIDGLVVDLPTAYYVTAAEIEDSVIVGQFEAQQGGEQFGLLFQKGNPLVGCVNKVLAELTASGELKAIQDEWLAGTTAPYFTEQ
ncbi:MAG: transporter substrate-binding domain-containing protein [Actinobacteria bacterium]|jgi:polar amino acid transport system substrate-binding protein|nr:transporter substrate-binding domain-containing protein [Actinomycetota bacterium]